MKHSLKKCFLIGLAISAAVLFINPGICIAEEAEFEARVVVLPGGEYSYGTAVIGSKYTLFPSQALGQPDNQSATIMFKGSITIQLGTTISGTDTVSIWATGGGLQSSSMYIYISETGKKWTLIGSQEIVSGEISRFDFTGSFGNVGYIRIERGGWALSWLNLDAVGAKGGG